MEAGDQRGKVRVWVTFQVTCAVVLPVLPGSPPTGRVGCWWLCYPTLHTEHRNYRLGSRSPACWGCPGEQCPTGDRARRGPFGFAAFLPVQVRFCLSLPR